MDAEFGRAHPEPADVFDECDACGKPIRFGNALVALIKNVEQIDRSVEYPGGDATVLNSETLMQFCAECGAQVDSEVLERILKTILIEGAPGEN